MSIATLNRTSEDLLLQRLTFPTEHVVSVSVFPGHFPPGEDLNYARKGGWYIRVKLALNGVLVVEEIALGEEEEALRVFGALQIRLIAESNARTAQPGPQG